VGRRTGVGAGSWLPRLQATRKRLRVRPCWDGPSPCDGDGRTWGRLLRGFADLDSSPLGARASGRALRGNPTQGRGGNVPNQTARATQTGQSESGGAYTEARSHRDGLATGSPHPAARPCLPSNKPITRPDSEPLGCSCRPPRAAEVHKEEDVSVAD
jgi:hypothetical protein